MSIFFYKQFNIIFRQRTKIQTSKSPSSTLTAIRRYTLHLAHKGVSNVNKAVRNTPPPNRYFPPNRVAR